MKIKFKLGAIYKGRYTGKYFIVLNTGFYYDDGSHIPKFGENTAGHKIVTNIFCSFI